MVGVKSKSTRIQRSAPNIDNGLPGDEYLDPVVLISHLDVVLDPTVPPRSSAVRRGEYAEHVGGLVLPESGFVGRGEITCQRRVGKRALYLGQRDSFWRPFLPGPARFQSNNRNSQSWSPCFDSRRGDRYPTVNPKKCFPAPRTRNRTAVSIRSLGLTKYVGPVEVFNVTDNPSLLTAHSPRPRPPSWLQALRSTGEGSGCFHRPNGGK